MERLQLLDKQFQPQLTKFGVNNFIHVPLAPPDAILSMTINFKNDKDPKKVNLGVGAYRDNNGKPYVFPIVKKVEAEIVADPSLDKEYAPIEGVADFIKGSQMVVFGWDNPDLASGRFVTCQCLSGTGSLRVLAEFLSKFRKAPIYISKPTWANHTQIFQHAGLEVREYTYYNPKTKGFDLDGMCKDLANAQPGSIILIHGCAHNPTGADPTPEQWHKLANVMKENDLFPFFDLAYQGFASGDLDKDGYGVRHFLKEGFQMVVAQSFAKTMGLYGERTGALHIVCADKPTAEKVMSQVKISVRSNYSNPPLHGARIAGKILVCPKNRATWLGELKAVTDRMNNMRAALKEALIKNGCKGNWDHITTQIGMFSFLGLTQKQCEQMVGKHHIYMTLNGRISIAGLTTSNVEYVANAIKDVVDNY
jgi:aspartate/tyrosine/aromatic aminotransferase